MGDTLPPSGIRPPADPKGPPFVKIWDIHFWQTDLKFFLKVPLAPNYTNFEGGERAEKKQFFARNIPKSASKRFFLFDFFKNLPVDQIDFLSSPK